MRIIIQDRRLNPNQFEKQIHFYKYDYSKGKDQFIDKFKESTTSKDANEEN